MKTNLTKEIEKSIGLILLIHVIGLNSVLIKMLLNVIVC
jgi:hypothetical protein